MYTFSESQHHFAQSPTKQSLVGQTHPLVPVFGTWLTDYSVSHTSIVVRDLDKAQGSAIDQEVNKEKFKEWQNFKARLQGSQSQLPTLAQHFRLTMYQAIPQVRSKAKASRSYSFPASRPLRPEY